jgi:hypothetical protein
MTFSMPCAENWLLERLWSALALECGSLLPLFRRELARGGLDMRRHSGQQAGLTESGSKLPHSKAAAR